ncbi:MAG: hypothetical protein K8T20_01160 [Planctomycetes bacterium]|nr:hypothetical protein [Planctomycetota bacterium]
MRRLVVIVLAIFAITGIGVGAWFAFRGKEEEPAKVNAHPKLMQELAGKLDHVTLVISGRLMAEIYPCG